MGLLDVIILILVLSWVGGFSVSAGGGLVHILLVVALVMVIFRLARGGKALP